MCIRTVLPERSWREAIRGRRALSVLRRGWPCRFWKNGRWVTRERVIAWSWKPAATLFRWPNGCAQVEKKGADLGQSSGWQSRPGLLCDRSGGRDQDCAHLFKRALTHRVAARSKDAGAS